MSPQLNNLSLGIITNENNLKPRPTTTSGNKSCIQTQNKRKHRNEPRSLPFPAFRHYTTICHLSAIAYKDFRHKETSPLVTTAKYTSESPSNTHNSNLPIYVHNHKASNNLRNNILRRHWLICHVIHFLRFEFA